MLGTPAPVSTIRPQSETRTSARVLTLPTIPWGCDRPSRHDEAMRRLQTAIHGLNAAVGRQQREVQKFQGVITQLGRAVTGLGCTARTFQTSLAATAGGVVVLHDHAVALGRIMDRCVD